MKKNICRVALVLLLTVGETFFTALTLKAGIGTYACWDALSANVAELTGLKVATFSIIMHILFVFLQILMLRKAFRPIGLLQIPFAVLIGTLINFFYYNVWTFSQPSYPIQLILCVVSVIGVAFFLGFLTSLNLVSLPVETTCKIANDKFGWNYGALRIGIDIACIVISVALSLFFHIDFTIREGTIIAMFLLGPLENVFIKLLDPLTKRL